MILLKDHIFEILPLPDVGGVAGMYILIGLCGGSFRSMLVISCWIGTHLSREKSDTLKNKERIMSWVGVDPMTDGFKVQNVISHAETTCIPD